MEDKLQSDDLPQPLNESGEEPKDERLQPIQYAGELERSEICRPDAEGSSFPPECEGNGEERRSEDQEERAVEQRLGVADRDGEDSSLQEEKIILGFDEVMREGLHSDGDLPVSAEKIEKVPSSQEEEGVEQENIAQKVLICDVEDRVEHLDGDRVEPAGKDENQEDLIEKEKEDSAREKENQADEALKVDDAMLDDCVEQTEQSLVKKDGRIEEVAGDELGKEEMVDRKSESGERDDKVSPLPGGSVKEDKFSSLQELQTKEEEVNLLGEDSVKKVDNISALKGEEPISNEEEASETYEKDLVVKEELVDYDEEESAEGEEMDIDDGGPAMAAGRRKGSKQKTGQPRAAQGRRVRGPNKPKPREDESLCFICFDGGDLVLCDHRGCPKVYHPSCVNRDEEYFKAKGQWICGWHICSNCQKSARYLCYTCTYSLCKDCTKNDAGFVCVRGNKGFCDTCMKTVMLIETHNHADEDALDFDDKTSWLYYFKDYWVDLKEKLSLTLDELIRAKNPFKETHAVSQSVVSVNISDTASDNQIIISGKSSKRGKESTSSTKGRKRLRYMTEKDVAVTNVERASTAENIQWASKELLEFVAYVKSGDRSVLSKYDVQELLLEYIKENNLRDIRRKSQVICDSRLRSLFGKSRVGHLEMLKLLEPHFPGKDGSPRVTDDNQGGVVDPDPSQMDPDGSSDTSTKNTLDLRRKSCKIITEKESTKFDDYAAIDAHNVSLMYLRRNLMEELLDDTDTFDENVIGSFVRIRISGSGQNKDMYRLVQVVGLGKAAEKYKIGKRMTDVTVEILNLNKKEFLTIDAISNQDFTEEECRRLRQSVKVGFIDRLRVAQVEEKASALQSVRVKDWLENEKSKLGNLRDRASEKGRKKELRDCLEKLQQLSMPEECRRRLNEVPEVHIDAKMNPDYDSAEEEDVSFRTPDSNKLSQSSSEVRNDFSTGKGGSATWSSSDTARYSSRSTLKSGPQAVVLSAGPSAMSCRADELFGNQRDPTCQLSSPQIMKTELIAASVDSGILKNAQPLIKPGQPSGIQPQTGPGPLSACIASVSTSETEKLWHYQDPSGKTQGPFSMAQLRKWNSNGFFPSNLKVWRVSEKQDDSILLTDALSGKFQKDMVAHEPQSSNATTNVASIVDTRENNSDTGGRGNNNTQTAAAPLPGNYNTSKSDRWSNQKSSSSMENRGMANPVDAKPITYPSRWESSNNSNPRSAQAQAHDSVRPIAPPSRNLSQPQNYQSRDGRREYNSRWNNGSRDRQDSWNSNRPRRFQHHGRDSERQHSYRSSSSREFSGEQRKLQPANNYLNQVGSSAANIYPNQVGASSFVPPAHAPQPSSIDWASLQGALNRILPPATSVQTMNSGSNIMPTTSYVQPMNSVPNIMPTASYVQPMNSVSNIMPTTSYVQPMITAPSTIVTGNNMQQCHPNANVHTMNSVGGWASATAPNINAANMHQNASVLNNSQIPNLQTKPSEPAAPVPSGDPLVLSGSSAMELVDGSDKKQNVGSDHSNITPVTEQASNNNLNSGCIHPPKTQGTGDSTVITSDKLEPGTDCPGVDDKSASENKKASVSAAESGPISVVPNAVGSSVPAAPVSTQISEASSSSKQSGDQCSSPVLANQQAHNGLNVNPSQPLNMGWGMAPQVPNPGASAAQQVGNMVYTTIPGATNMGWGMVAQGVMNMPWGAPANMNMGWGPPVQATMNANGGLSMPAQGNVNVNLAWGAQAQADPNVGWEMSMQGTGQGGMSNVNATWDPSGGNPQYWVGQQQHHHHHQQAGDGHSSQGGAGSTNLGREGVSNRSLQIP